MYLLDIMDCEYISEIYSGNKEEDNKANAELYLKLVAEGNEKGFCPFIGNSSFIRAKNKHMFTEHMLDKKKWVQFYKDTRED